MRSSYDRDQYIAERRELARLHRQALQEVYGRPTRKRRAVKKTFKGEAKEFGTILWWHLRALFREFFVECLRLIGLR